MTKKNLDSYKRERMEDIKVLIKDIKGIDTTIERIEELYNRDKIFVLKSKFQLYYVLSNMEVLDNTDYITEIFRLVDIKIKKGGGSLIDQFFENYHIGNSSYDSLVFNEDKYPDLYLILEKGAIDILTGVDKLLNNIDTIVNDADLQYSSELILNKTKIKKAIRHGGLSVFKSKQEFIDSFDGKYDKTKMLDFILGYDIINDEWINDTMDVAITFLEYEEIIPSRHYFSKTLIQDNILYKYIYITHNITDGYKRTDTHNAVSPTIENINAYLNDFE